MTTIDNDKSMRQLVNAWVKDNIDEVGPNRMVHVHVDDLFSDLGRTPAEQLRAGTIAYQLAIDVLGDLARDIKAVLVIPLLDCDRLECTLPRLERLAEEMSDEPPSIYLVHRDSAKWLRAGELYRCLLLDSKLFDDQSDDVFVFFEVWRSEAGRRDGWEYARTIIAEHYVAEYHGQAH